MASCAIFLCVTAFVLALRPSDAQLGSTGGKINLNNPDVALSYCTVRGVEYPLSTGSQQQRYKILSYIGIPYAIPPVGTDRFRVSLPVIKRHQVLSTPSFRSPRNKLSTQLTAQPAA